MMKFDINEILAKFKYDPNSVKKNYDGRTDVYLAKVSYRFAYIKRWLVVLIILISVAFLLSGNISYEKFFYLTKDIKLANDYVTSVHDTITYNVGNSQSFASYRSGIAVASREKLSIFSSGGRELFSVNLDYGNPTLKTNDKHVLLYDVGGKQFSLYNSFSKVNEGVLNYPIYGASLSQNGNFALITKSEKYGSVVSVYQTNGTQYDYNFSNDRVSSVALSKNGLQLAVLLIRSDCDVMYTELRLYKLGSNDYSSAKLTFSGIPYEVQILDTNVVAVGANGVNAFNSGLALVGEYLSSDQIYSYSFGNNNLAVATLNPKTQKSEIIVLNKRGRVDKKLEFDERIIDVAIHNDHLFLQKISGFERVNIQLGLSEDIEMMGTGYTMIISDKDTLIVCEKSLAKFLNFDR